MIPYNQVEVLAARRLTEQQIADVLNIDLVKLKESLGDISKYREAIRKGRAKGEAELRGALYKRAKNGDHSAYIELMRREKDSS